MGLLDKLGLNFVYRKCPAGKYHKINKDDLSCGHTGQILDWCELYQKWIPNPTKTEMLLEMIEEDSEFAVEKEAKERLEEAISKGDLTPCIDYRRKIMGDL